MNIVKIREIADSLLDQGKYDDAYYVYDEISNQIWSSLGSVQNGLTEFSQSYLGNSYKSNFEFRDSYTKIAADSIFKKRFNLDPDQMLNELTFSTYGHLQAICYSPKLISEISVEIVYNEFIALHSLILETENDNWVNSLFKVITPVVENNQFKKLRSNLFGKTLTKSIVENASKIKSTDWYNVNITFLDYLINVGDNNSELYSSVYKVVGFHFKQKTHRKKTSKSKNENANHDTGQYDSYESYEKYERYEKFEKHSFKKEKEFDPTTATEYEKAKYFGQLLGLTGRVTKSQIRTKYLNLISQYHPDKVYELGDELKILAEKKTKQLNLAYEWMKKKYNL
jgi:hypothetical protein